MGRLEGKTCLVTAAGQGIGRATALAMKAEGARVFATDVNEPALEDLAAQGLQTSHLDVLDPASIAKAAEHVGAPDVCSIAPALSRAAAFLIAMKSNGHFHSI